MDFGDMSEGGRNRAADHEASDARHARSIARAEGLGDTAAEARKRSADRARARGILNEFASRPGSACGGDLASEDYGSDLVDLVTDLLLLADTVPDGLVDGSGENAARIALGHYRAETEGGSDADYPAADHPSSDADAYPRPMPLLPREEEPTRRVVTADPAAVHLAAMRDLAARIQRMHEGGSAVAQLYTPADLAELGLELAELVSHYEPATFGEEHPQSEAMLGALSWARTALDDPASVPNEMFAPYRAHLGGTAYYKAEADVRMAFAIDRIDDAMQAIQGKEA